jgi:hypothetical protein
MRVMSRRREVAMDESDAAALANAPEPDADQAVCNCLYKILPTLKPEYAEIVWRADLLGEPRDRIAVSMLRCASTMAASLEEAARGDLPRLRRDRVPRLQLLAKLRSTLLRAAAPICQCGQAIACLSHAEN